MLYILFDRGLMKNMLMFLMCLLPVGFLSAQTESQQAQTVEAEVPADVDMTANEVVERLGELERAAAEIHITDAQQDIVDEFVPKLAQRLFSIMGFMALLAAILPKGSKTGTFIAFLRSMLDALAANWLNAKNR